MVKTKSILCSFFKVSRQDGRGGGVGNVQFYQLNKILAKSKFSICSGENLYSLFTIDCINNNVKVISNIKPNTNNKHFDKSIIYVKSFKNLNESKIYHIL